MNEDHLKQYFAERAERQAAAFALTNISLSGFTLTSDAARMNQQYVDGLISSEECLALLLKKYRQL